MKNKLGGLGVLLLVLGAGMLANGIWMLADTARWFGKIAAVTGALNPHLVRDVGAAYVTVGVALTWAAFRPGWRFPLTAVATVFLVIHALDHVVETGVGILPAHQWWADLPGVYLPAVITLVLTVSFARAPQGRTS